ncbi:MAG TPA: hypothetical protein VMR98_04520 [Candidatus Polarisedimenticolaceae bacterium]|nr:hypothetical protein [Candidatus Polarisedimenticolaceae bacterium]
MYITRGRARLGLLVASLLLAAVPLAAQAAGSSSAVRTAQAPELDHKYDPFEEIGWMAKKANADSPVLLNPGMSNVFGRYDAKKNIRRLRVTIWNPCDGPAVDAKLLAWLELTPLYNRQSSCTYDDHETVTGLQTNQRRIHLMRQIWARFTAHFVRAAGCLKGNHVRFKSCPKYPMPNEIGAAADGSSISWPGRCVRGVSEMIIHTLSGLPPTVEMTPCRGPVVTWDVTGRVVSR